MIKRFTQPKGQTWNILLHWWIFSFLKVSSYFKRIISKWQKGKKSSVLRQMHWACDTSPQVPHDPENRQRFSLIRARIQQLIWEHNAQNYKSSPVHSAFKFGEGKFWSHISQVPKLTRYSLKVCVRTTEARINSGTVHLHFGRANSKLAKPRIQGRDNILAPVLGILHCQSNPYPIKSITNCSHQAIPGTAFFRVLTPSKTFSWSLARLSPAVPRLPADPPAHRWRSAAPGQAGNVSCPSKETVCSSKASLLWAQASWTAVERLAPSAVPGIWRLQPKTNTEN